MKKLLAGRIAIDLGTETIRVASADKISYLPSTMIISDGVKYFRDDPFHQQPSSIPSMQENDYDNSSSYQVTDSVKNGTLSSFTVAENILQRLIKDMVFYANTALFFDYPNPANARSKLVQNTRLGNQFISDDLNFTNAYSVPKPIATLFGIDDNLDDVDQICLIECGAGTFSISNIQRHQHNKFVVEQYIDPNHDFVDAHDEYYGGGGITQDIIRILSGEKYGFRTGPKDGARFKKLLSEMYTLNKQGKRTYFDWIGRNSNNDVFKKRIHIDNFVSELKERRALSSSDKVISRFYEELANMFSEYMPERTYFVGGGANFSPLSEMIKNHFNGSLKIFPSGDITIKGLQNILNDKVLFSLYARPLDTIY